MLFYVYTSSLMLTDVSLDSLVHFAICQGYHWRNMIFVVHISYFIEQEFYILHISPLDEPLLHGGLESAYSQLNATGPVRILAQY